MRLLLDWGADAQAGVGDRSMGSSRDMSIISRSYSVATRSMTSKQMKRGGERLNQSVVENEYKLKHRK